ncbi:MAG: hypothetical protein K6G32_09520 [Prevotella sp.]|nr:hypothetical protein [Prevotella sp.]
MKKLFSLLLAVVILPMLSSCFFADNPLDDPNNNNQGGSSYSFISEEDLGDWQEGIIDENGFFLVAKKDEASDYYMAYFSQKGKEESDGVLFYFDENYNLSTMITPRGLCNISRNQELKKALLTVYLADGSVSMEEINYSDFTNITNKKENITRASDISSIISRISGPITGLMDLGNNLMLLGDAINAINNLFAGNWRETLTLLAKNGVSAVLTTGSTAGTFGLNIAIMYLEHRYREWLEALPVRFMQEAKVYVSDIKKVSNGKYTITVEVSGFNGIDLSSYFSLNTGLAVRINNPNVSYNQNNWVLKEHQIKKDESYPIDLPVTLGDDYYVVPFLIVMVDGIVHQFPLTVSSSLYYYNETPIVKYGEIRLIRTFNGMIDGFEQTKAEAINNGIIYFEGEATAHMDASDRSYKDWGVYVLNDNGETKMFPFTGNSSFTVFEEVRKENIKDIDYAHFEATYHSRLGVYYVEDAFMAQTQYGTPIDVYYKYSKKPVAETGTSKNVEKKSATVVCKYEDFSLWDGTCGVEYWSGSEKFMAFATPTEGTNCDIPLADLKPGTTYNYRAFVNVSGNYTYAKETKQFKTKDDGLLSCPDANHPHWIDLGLPSGTQWRCCNVGASSPEAYGGYYTFGLVSTAPTFNQIKELLDNTTSVWTQLNGVNGRKFTGSNGGTIFLPAAGYVSDGGFYTVGTYGFYLSSTPNGEYYAYGLYFDSSLADWDDSFYSRRYVGESVRPVR